MRRTTPYLIALLLAVPLVPPPGAGGTAHADEPGSRVPDREEIRYHWSLGGLLGTVAGLFLPSSGEGVMSVEPAGEGELRTELMITSRKSNEGEYWRYGSRIAADSGHALEAWDAYQWRGETDHDRQEIDVPGVHDIVSTIYQLRRRLPDTALQMRVWSDGDLYPVVAIPRGEDIRDIAGEKVTTRHYTVRGYKSGDGKHWKGSLELWFARDAAATPVEMHIRRSLARLRLEAVEAPAA